MAKINDTTTYPNTTPALTDHVIGTDVSDTGNDANGEVVTFTFQGLMDLFEANGAAPASFISSGTFADARIAESNVTQHEAALSITESQISDFGTYSTTSHTHSLDDLSDVDATVGSPSDGDILVYRSAGSDWVLEAKPAAGSNPAAADITDATADGIALITSADANPFTDADESKLDGIEASADVTDETNVLSALNSATLSDIGTPASGDLVLIKDVSGGGFKTALFSEFGTALADPGADRLVGWDDSAGTSVYFAPGSGLSITDTTLNAEVSLAGSETLTNKTIDGDNNTISNLDLGNEVEWATITDLTDRTAFASGDKLMIFEAGVGMRRIDYDDLPGAGGGLSNVVEDTTPQLGGDLDGQGNEIANYTNAVVTSVSGALTVAAHSGNVIKTSGNVTVPTTAGFTCTIIAGGAHTVTFNSTTSAAMATGDVMTVVVESSTVIHAVLTASADKVSFS